MDYKVKDYTIVNSRGLKIEGRLYAPIGEGKYKTAIFAHGFGGNYREIEDYGPKFAEEHVALFIFDFCGGGNDVYSEGRTEEMSVLTEADDYECVYEFVKDLSEVDSNNIIFMGASQGGLVAALTASRLAGNAKGLILWYPALCIADDMRKRLEDGREYVEKVWEMNLGKIYTEDILSFDIYEKIKAYSGEVLIFHGDCDDVVPFEYSKKAVEAFKNAKLVEFKGAGHGFSKEDRKTAKELAIEFINSQNDSLLEKTKIIINNIKKENDDNDNDDDKRSFWDKSSVLYDLFENFYNGKVNRELCIEVAKLIDDKDNVLECACGTGMITKSIAKKAGKVTATDYSIGMLNQAAKKLSNYSNVKIKRANIMNLKSSDDRFDKVIAGNVIHLLDDPKKAIEELLRVCKAGGKVIIPTYINNENAGSPGIFIKVIENFGAGFKCQFDYKSYKEFFKKMGYENVEYRIVNGKMPCAIAIITK